MNSKILTESYFQNPDVLHMGRDLLGKLLVTPTAIGIITETESYMGPEDKASHAYNNRRTDRTEVMFWKGGYSYVYLCYGIHNLFNIITGSQDVPHAVLIRGIMLLDSKKVITGPGLVTRAMGITRAQNGLKLTPESGIWLEDASIPVTNIEALPRVGIDYAEDYVHMPWRFKTHLSWPHLETSLNNL